MPLLTANVSMSEGHNFAHAHVTFAHHAGNETKTSHSSRISRSIV